MSARGPRSASLRAFKRIRLIGLGGLIALTLLMALNPAWTDMLREAWFDAQQTMAPRDVATLPVTIVEIDQKSLQVLGQWPWPRNRLANLVDAINQAAPTAIALDIVMAEADALSPERALALTAFADPALTAVMQALPANDDVLARALKRAPTVLAFAGTLEPGNSVLRSAPVMVQPRHSGDVAAPALKLHAGALASIDLLNRQVSGWGLISVDPTRGVVRRMPLVASINGTLVPSLALEMLRVASRASSLRLHSDGSAARAVQVGALTLPTEADGAVRPYFSARLASRFVSAVDVLAGKVDADMLHGRLVIIGPTAIAMHDEQNTPLGERMPGSEIHAQLIENLVDGTLLNRPTWAADAESAWLLLMGAAMVWATPRLRPLHGAMLALAALALPLAASVLLFRSQRLLIDAVTPGLFLFALFVGMLMLTLVDSTRQRRALELQVQSQREQAARIAGELEAAQRIQMGSLPRLDLFAGDARIDLHATLTPAREVGGDLYEFFMLDRDRLFFLIGDVAGKGLSASIFMAVSKALYKGSMLRAPQADIGDIMGAANAEVSRDNAQMLFVTAFAAILDLQSGALRYCNAGHDNPYRLRSGATDVLRIEDGDGPPLCAMADYAYASAACQLQPGETVCLMTDGVFEAQSRSGALYGTERALQSLQGQQARGANPRQLVDALQADVQAFCAGAEAADDLTILALRWNGPRSAAATPA